MVEELELRYIWSIVLKRKKIVIAIAIIAILLALINTYLLTPTDYTASTTLLVAGETETLEIREWQIDVSRKVSRTYGAMATTRLVLDKTLDNLNLAYSYAYLRNSVSVDYIEGTELMTISVRNGHPLIAKNLANELSENLISEVTAIYGVDNLILIDPAVSASSSGPNTRANIIIALVIGLMAGVGLAFFLDFLDNTIKTPRDVSKVLSLPVLGNIPASTPRVKSFPCKDPLTAAYRFMVNNIQFAGLNKDIKSILVTPTNPEGSKVTFASNLGIILAKGGSSVLLIDAVYNNPTLHKIFDLDNNKGFSNIILEEDILPEEVIKKTENQRLFVVTAGSNGPETAIAKPLTMQMINKLLDYFSELFDYVIFNTPQLITYTDVAVIASRADATVMGLDYGEVNYDEATFAKEQLERAGANIIGAVINNIPSEQEETIIPNFNINGKISKVTNMW